jgi:dTDP-4-amino-4,6-dideoxygalactose transaminase
MTAFATVLAVIRAGAEPVLADIDPETALLSPESATRCLSPRTRAVLLVHLYGQVRRMEEWTAFCKQAGIHLLEDCAQSHGARWRGAAAGNFGAWGAYSFYPTKNLGAIGDGGAIVTNSGEIAEKARVFRNYGQSERYHHPELGLNSRLDELQAAILSARLGWLDSFTKRRREIAEAYSRGISNPRVRPLARPADEASHVHHLFVVLCEERDRLAAYLKERRVSSLVHYPVPVHLQKPCQGLGRDPQGLANAERHANHCLSIPCHPQMSGEEVRTVIEAINAFK